MPFSCEQLTTTPSRMRSRIPVVSRPQAIDDSCVELARLHAHTVSGIARNATPLRDSRATPHGGSERSQAAGEAGLTPASLLLDPASLQPIRVVSGGGGIRTLEGPNGP